ncbi:aminotransferase class I/II-fold pyridoxal phosphate-dependent enzyme [Altererythrobacter xixiisoli]|uniref:Aminotransferase class I/II-fold pyridoxal phosphate-dependent enzyme n=1 Tax=Croceibacterium xixiisoli TaxID=1476466 RepID=A0A6I4U143_9SPHN|nr:PLP-dependent aminotransferase family protein [Croceibacterium xixiisoli]MXP00668.1 aminotransferase class I/II-fold pyridoxal phosphate-dependent enzyme [Croceibacterium xixiisoli]
MGIVVVQLDQRMGARQIYEALREQILAGVFGRDGHLPSSRSLAQDLGVSRTTVTLAFEQLHAEGFIRMRQGARAQIAPTLGNQPEPKVSPPKPTTASLSAYGQRIAVVVGWRDQAEQTLVADFRHGDLTPSDFPATAWKRAINQAMDQRSQRLAYDDPRGSRRLRMALQGYLWRARTIRCDLAQVLIVNGSQQGLDLCARLLLETGDSFVIEDPCYAMARQIFGGTGAVAHAIPVDAEGIRSDRLDKFAARLAYVTPSHQFPLGSVMSVSRRHSLLQWAGRHGAYIVEDDYDSEFRYDINPVPPLYGLSDGGDVIYLGTVSKTLSPALRLGFLVVPVELADVFAKAKLLMDRHSPALEQEALATLIESGAYERHIRRVRRFNRDRREALLSALRRHFGGGIAIEGAEAGLHVTVRFPGLAAAQEAALITRARQHGLGLYPLSPLYQAPPDAAGGVGLVMGYSGLDPRRIERGVEILAGVVGSF